MRCRKNKESKELKTEGWCFYQNLWCAIVKKTKFLTKQEAKVLLSKLTGIKVLLLSDLSILNAKVQQSVSQK